MRKLLYSGGRKAKLLIIGGTPRHFGGVETFTARAAETVKQHVTQVEPVLIPSGTAYISLWTAPHFVAGLFKLLVIRLTSRQPLVWLNYVNLADLTYLVVAKGLGCRVLVTPHLGANWRSQRSPRLRALSERLLRLADRFALIAPTQEEEISLPQKRPRSVIRTFLPSEVLEDWAAAEMGGVALKLIHASRLSVGKGSYSIVDVCSRLRALGVPFSAQMIGRADHDTLKALQTKIAAAQLGEQLELTGFKPPCELIGLMRRADILLHLSTVDSYPLILLEALACGMFPIAVDLAGARDIIEKFDGKIVSQEHAVEETVKFLASADRDQLRRRGLAQAKSVRAYFARETVGRELLAALHATSGAQLHV